MICNVVGARPNFMKMSPVVDELRRRGIPQMLVHTGQHYDRQMSAVFFEDLGLPAPDAYLGVGSGSHARQTAEIMKAFESVCMEQRFQLVMVGGDVNSTIACALVAAKLNLPVAHVEAGLRSFDRSMPEEINRILTDHLSEYLFTTEESANQNLRREGCDEASIHFVGNCMVDTLLKHVDVAIGKCPWHAFDYEARGYALLTLHRPANVDQEKTMRDLVTVLNEISQDTPILFPVHPRTRERILALKIRFAPGITICDPLPYLSFLGLMARARFVLTDSGGIQEETTVLKVPCLTLRGNTERPATTTMGTNRLVGLEPAVIRQGVSEILSGQWPLGQTPPLWDGAAAIRLVDVIEKRIYCTPWD
jgi:UDP-N-acetylglucosamine 2-epimerase (non-hydrolysing)